jgi:hypothetical protein
VRGRAATDDLGDGLIGQVGEVAVGHHLALLVRQRVDRGEQCGVWQIVNVGRRRFVR